jgi:hypothetical protein
MKKCLIILVSILLSLLTPVSIVLATNYGGGTYGAGDYNSGDAVAPSGGSISYFNGYASPTVAIVVNDGSDTDSGINTSSRIIQRKSAELSNNTCGTYGSFSNITSVLTGNYPNYVDSTILTGYCYQYQYLVSDNAGNQAISTSSDTVKVDTTVPTDASISINNDAEYTNNTSVNLILNASDLQSGISSMIISESQNFTGASWEDYSAGKDFVLSSGDGIKTVYVQFKNASGLTSAVVSDSITLDSVINDPVISSIVTSDGFLNYTDSIYYLLTANPQIKGTADPGNTISFVIDSTIYTVIADDSGNFTITFSNPVLSDGSNHITYFSKDLANNESTHKVLNMVVGEKYFPNWLINELNPSTSGSTNNNSSSGSSGNQGDNSNTGGSTNNNGGTGDNNVPDTNTVTPILINGLDGKPLVNTDITVDGIAYTTNENGYALVKNLTSGSHEVKVSIHGKTYTSSFVLSTSDIQTGITVDIKEERVFPWKYVLGGIGVLVLIVGVIVLVKKKNKHPEAF